MAGWGESCVNEWGAVVQMDGDTNGGSVDGLSCGQWLDGWMDG